MVNAISSHDDTQNQGARPDTAPLVTVAIAAHNASAYVASAVHSALRQTLGDLEVLVVDDCSTDDTCAVVAALARSDARVRLERLPHNQGPGGARNHALSMARGTWFAVLDSDDLFAPDRLEKLIAAASREGADIVADNPVEFDDPTDGQIGGNPSLFLRNLSAGRWLSLEHYLRETMMFAPDGANYGYLKPVFRTQRLREGGFCYDPSLRIAEDDDLIVRLLLAGMRYWLEPVPTYGYRKHPSSISHRLSAANAAAMTRAGRALAESHAGSPSSRLLEQRWKAFARSTDFARLIEALKARSALPALRLILHSPGIVPLLRMPIRAALMRLSGRNPDHREAVFDPVAQAALKVIFSSQD